MNARVRPRGDRSSEPRIGGGSAAIFFFSGTGNTWWCARTLAALLRVSCDVDARPYPVETLDRDRTESILASVGLAGICYPVYGSDLPEPMKRFIDQSLPGAERFMRGESPGIRLFTLCTQLMFSGDGAQVYRRELEAKGWRIRWSAHVAMPNNISVPGMPFAFTNDRRKIDPVLARARSKLERFSDALAGNGSFLQGAGPGSRALGVLQRGPYRRMFPRLRSLVGIDPGRCTECGRCVRLCPERNLEPSPGGIRPLGRCSLCLRCYNFCPALAVTYSGRLHDPGRGSPYRGPVPDFEPERMFEGT